VFNFRDSDLGYRGHLLALERFLGARTPEQIESMAYIKMEEWSQFLKYHYSTNTGAYWVAKWESSFYEHGYALFFRYPSMSI